MFLLSIIFPFCRIDRTLYGSYYRYLNAFSLVTMALFSNKKKRWTFLPILVLLSHKTASDHSIYSVEANALICAFVFASALSGKRYF